MEYPKTLTPTECTELRDRGDCDGLILGHLRLVRRCAKQHARKDRNGSNIDDYFSEGCQGLVHAVNKLVTVRRNLKDVAIQKYISLWIRHAISEYRSKLSCVHVPLRTVRQHAEEGHKINFAVWERTLDSVADTVAVDDHSQLEVDELLDSIIKTANERRVYELRLDGHTDCDIGKIIGMSTTSVWNIRQLLIRRYENVVSAEIKSSQSGD